jgi:hypothetical protein
MKAIPLMKLNYIKKLIELLKKQTATYVEDYKYRLEDNAKENKRQLDKIILPAIANFIKSVMAYSITRGIILLAIEAAGKTEEVLKPANIFKEIIVIPDAYTGVAYRQILSETDPSEDNTSEANLIEEELIKEELIKEELIKEELIQDAPYKDNTSEEQEGNMTTRRNLILAMAKDVTLIEEFINDLIIFNKGANGTLLSDSEKFKLTMTAPIDLTGGRKYRTINKVRSFRKKTRRNKKLVY